VVSAELQADVSQDPLDIFPGFPQTAQVIDGELEHSAHLKSRRHTDGVISTGTVTDRVAVMGMNSAAEEDRELAECEAGEDRLHDNTHGFHVDYIKGLLAFSRRDVWWESAQQLLNLYLIIIGGKWINKQLAGFICKKHRYTPALINLGLEGHVMFWSVEFIRFGLHHLGLWSSAATCQPRSTQSERSTPSIRSGMREGTFCQRNKTAARLQVQRGHLFPSLFTSELCVVGSKVTVAR